MSNRERLQLTKEEALQWAGVRVQAGDWHWNGDINTPARCFFCGRSIRHFYAETCQGGPAIGWGMLVVTPDGQWHQAMLCQFEPCDESVEVAQAAKEVFGYSAPAGSLIATVVVRVPNDEGADS